jgi:hypothetical protein
MPEFLRALELNPVGATTHAAVATILMAAWPAMSETQRADARPIIERAVKLSGGDRSLKEQWAVVSRAS